MFHEIISDKRMRLASREGGSLDQSRPSMSPIALSTLFDDPAAWQVFASGQAQGRLSRISGPGGGPGLRLDYDFHGGGGFVVIRRVMRFAMPETFEIGFQLRGEGPPNHFEFKVADPGGSNVWRNLSEDFALPESWAEYRFNERNLPFAWGPAGGGPPSEIEAIEFVIAAGPGGKGVLELALPTFEDQTLRAPRRIRASSEQAGHPAAAVFGAGSRATWKASRDDRQPWWEVDFGRSLRFGGLVIGWPDDLPPRAFEVEASADGTEWTRIHRAEAARGPKSHLATPGAEARLLRITFADPACAALDSLAIRPDAYSRTPSQFIHHVAADYPRGWFPRYWLREQSYWTPVGTPDGKRRALINEEGLLEVDEAGFSLEPFVLSGGKAVTWADVETAARLPEGGIPMPSVTWTTEDIQLEVLPWVDGVGDDLALHVTYRLTCRQAAEDTRLIVAVRPLQVNPPWQAFRNLGGHSPIHRIACGVHGMNVDGREILASPAADASGATVFEEGGILSILASGAMPSGPRASDEGGMASGAMSWALRAGATTLEVTLSMPYFSVAKQPAENSRADALARWQATLGRVRWEVPTCAAGAFDCFRTAAGHILINRDGPAIQPGPRRYTRSWVRDCVIMGAALAKAGLPEALHEFLTWYARFQRDDGFVPCVVDRDGVDWLVEHDSHGQFLWGIREVVRAGGDPAFLGRMMPHVIKAAGYLIALRGERMTAEYQSGERARFYGLLPESASHEGYLAHPVHSYWDDFWGIRGLEAAADLAAGSGLTEESARWRDAARSFQADLLKSIDKVISDKQLAYIPGSVEWADFDPTATSNAIAQLDFAGVLPVVSLHAILDTYLDGFRRKHRGEMPWNNYTAYEIRIIGAFVRLGRRDEANELLEFFLSDRRPTAWNQWPEITWRDPRSPGHLGDVPHTWIAAEYLLALASMVASEREASDSMVLASGMPWAWISDEAGFAVEGLPTRYGALDFRIKAAGDNSIEVEVGGTLTLPPGGLSIAPPLPAGKWIVSVAGSGVPPVIASMGEAVTAAALPFSATLRLGDPQVLA
jgi:hypothetical protein